METRKTAPTKLQLPQTYDDLVEAKRAELHEFYRMLDVHRTQIKELIHSTFVANGGCGRCHGRGWVVTWDTMDCMDGSYAEYGTCPESGCTAETRTKSGLDSTWSKYDDNRRVVDPTKKHPLVAIVCEPLRACIARLERDENELRMLAKPGRGRMAVVVRGRKVTVGTCGIVAFMKDSGSVLLKSKEEWTNRSAQGVWVDSRNLAMVV